MNHTNTKISNRKLPPSTDFLSLLKGVSQRLLLEKYKLAKLTSAVDGGNFLLLIFVLVWFKLLHRL